METPVRKIIHVDLDAFYASVEQLDHPELRGKPVIVGGDPRSRGVVATASYEARRYGVRSAMPCAQARRLCPQGVFVRPNFKRYIEISRKVRAIFEEVTDLVEPLSLDEAYLDVTENKLGEPLARTVAEWIRSRIRDEIGITASAGVASVKFVAKIASDLRKPDGLVVIPPEKIEEFVRKLPVEKLWGVGPATASRLLSLGIRTTEDIRALSVARVEEALGKHGRFLHELSHGRDPREVVTHRDPKSRGAECTFEKDVLDLQVLREAIREQAEDVSRSLSRLERAGKTVTLKLRYGDFETITRSRTLASRTMSADHIASVACTLLDESTEAGTRPVRLAGISVSGLSVPGEWEQLVFDWLKAGWR